MKALTQNALLQEEGEGHTARPHGGQVKEKRGGGQFQFIHDALE